MSTLTECDKAKIKKIFQMENGGVLGFHDIFGSCKVC